MSRRVEFSSPVVAVEVSGDVSSKIKNDPCISLAYFGDKMSLLIIRVDRAGDEAERRRLEESIRAYLLNKDIEINELRYCGGGMRFISRTLPFSRN